jgi:hypothetical protein
MPNYFIPFEQASIVASAGRSLGCMVFLIKSWNMDWLFGADEG